MVNEFGISRHILLNTGVLGGSVIKSYLPVQEAQIRSLGQEDPLEKGVAAHSGILVWEIPWTEEPGRLHSPWGRKESDLTLETKQQQLLLHRQIDR